MSYRSGCQHIIPTRKAQGVDGDCGSMPSLNWSQASDAPQVKMATRHSYVPQGLGREDGPSFALYRLMPAVGLFSSVQLQRVDKMPGWKFAWVKVTVTV